MNGLFVVAVVVVPVSFYRSLSTFLNKKFVDFSRSFSFFLLAQPVVWFQMGLFPNFNELFIYFFLRFTFNVAQITTIPYKISSEKIDYELE